MTSVRREARKLVAQLTLPSPWSIADVCAQVGRLRGREVIVEEVSPDAAGGATAAVRREADRDVVTYRADHHGADHLIAHELGHLLAGDLDGAPDLTNTVSVDVVEAVRIMQRSCAYDDHAESLAEAVADLIMAGARVAHPSWFYRHQPASDAARFRRCTAMMSTSVQSLCLGVAGFVALAVAAERVVAYRERPDSARAYLVISLIALGFALILNVSAVGRVLNQDLLRVPNAAVLVSQLFAAAGAWAAVEMVVASAGRPRRSFRAARAVLLLAASVALVVSFSLVSVQPESPVIRLYANTASIGDRRPYWVVFGVIAFIPSGFVAVLAARYARQAALWLRVGLYCVAAGVALNAAFGALLIVSLWATTVTWLPAAQMGVAALGGVLVGAGCALPHLPEARSRRAIRPVWTSLTALYPEVRVGHRPDLRRIVTEVHDCVVVARTRDEIASPMIRAVDRLPPRPADHFDDTVADLVAVARLRLSPVWDDQPSVASAKPAVAR